MSLAEVGHGKLPRPVFRGLVGVFLLLGVLHVVMFSHWGTAPVVPNIPWVIAVTNTFMTLAALSVAFLSFGRHQVLRDPVSFWTGTGMAGFALCNVFYMLAWPGLLPGGGTIIGHVPSTAGWIGLLSVSVLGGCLLAAVWARWPGPQPQGARIWPWWVAAFLLLIGGLNLLAVALENALPTLVETSGKFTLLAHACLWVVLLLYALGTVTSTRYYLRARDTLPGYAALTQIAFCVLILVATLCGNRFGLLFFSDRFLGVGGFLAMLFGLLLEYVQLYRREQDRVGELQARAAELSQLKTALEIRVQERTTDLAVANQNLEAFAYTVSHDLRAPLRHIMGFAKLLQQQAGSLDDDGRHFVQIISEGTQRMDKLIEDLLKLSRLDHAPLKKADVPLARLVEEIRRELAPETAGREIQWQIGALPTVRADPTLLRTVLVNLLHNAVKYTGATNPARIEVGTRQQNGEVVCFVRDNGAGFNMEYAHKLFGAFQRLHTTQQFEGTGIGLASVRRIIQRHGGRTWEEGAVNEGATIYFSLPDERRLARTEEETKFRGGDGVPQAEPSHAERKAA